MADRVLGGQLVRFLLVGGANTLLTYLLLLGLIHVLDARLAYTIAFVVGVAANTLLAAPLVFSSRPSGSRRLLYAVWLVVLYLVGLGTVQLALLADLRYPPLLAALPLLVTAPLNFLGGRVLLADPVPSRGQERLPG